MSTTIQKIKNYNLQKNKIFIGTSVYLALVVTYILIFNIKSLTISDGLMQYTAFIQNSMTHIFSGEWYKLAYDSTLGLGQPFINIFMYYGLSPFNILLIFPFMNVSLIIFIKMIVLALTTNYFFSKRFSQLTIKEHLFFVLTFLASNAIMIIVTNYIWLDSTIGMIWLIYLINTKVKHKNLLLTSIVIYMIWSNFYLSIIYLLFIGLYTLFKRQFKSAVFIILGGVLSITPIILGSYQNLITRNIMAPQSTHLIDSPKNYITHGIQILASPIQLFGQLSKYMNTTVNIGVPSIIFILMLIIVIKNYKTPESWIIGVMMLSVTSPKINALFHGGQLPSGWDYRFSPLLLLLMLTLLATEICKNRENNKSTFLQLETIINTKYLWYTGFTYTFLLIGSVVIATTLYPSIPKQIVELSGNSFQSTILIICIAYLIAITFINFTLISKKKFKIIEILTFSALILLVGAQFGTTYKLVKPKVTVKNVTAIRKKVQSWENNQSNKTLLNKSIKISDVAPTLINTKITQSSAFVTPVSPYLTINNNIYMFEANRVTYNVTVGNNTISNILYGPNFEINSTTHKWAQYDNLDRGFVINNYIEPTSTKSYLKLLSDDTINIKSKNLINLKVIDSTTIDVSLSNSANANKTYVLKYNFISEKTGVIPAFKVLNKGKHYKLNLSKDNFKSTSTELYETPKHIQPKKEYKNTFEITSGQTKNHILKGTSKTNGDLILKVLYDKNIHVKINGKSSPTKRAFNALILVPNVKTGDVIELTYDNPTIKTMFIFTIISFAIVGVSAIAILKTKKERSAK